MPSSTGPTINRRAAFTLLEVVLAIGLTATLLALLSTAIDLYLNRVETTRSKVEAAQVARTLLNRMAEDIRAVRYYAPKRSGAAAGSGVGSNSQTESAAQVVGLFGTQSELRVDRMARWNWQRMTREVDATEITPAELMPLSVRYSYGDGKTMLANELAASGLAAENAPLTGYAGLYHQQTPTAAAKYQASATGVNLTTLSGSSPELLAPEVLGIEFAYFDGQQWLDSWDSAASNGLPVAVEIELSMLMEPFEIAQSTTSLEREARLRSSENTIVYRRVVRLPEIKWSNSGPSNTDSSSAQGGGAQSGNQDNGESDSGS